jgi:hypothetical protein
MARARSLDPQPLQIIQLPGQSLEITIPIGVAVVETGKVDAIEHGVLIPGWSVIVVWVLPQ